MILEKLNLLASASALVFMLGACSLVTVAPPCPTDIESDVAAKCGTVIYKHDDGGRGNDRDVEVSEPSEPEPSEPEPSESEEPDGYNQY